MRHGPETVTDRPEEGTEKEESGRRRIDLSVAQVSGSALAAVIAAKLASTLGVYGTIVGAGVISVIATCGGPLFQYAFRRTGEQVRGATAARPKARQVPFVSAAERDDPTLLLAAVPPPLPERPRPDGEEFGEATTHGTRVRGWKRPAVAAALVFGVTMGGITAYELVAGEDFSGRQGTTTFGSAVRGGSGGQHAPDPGGDTTPAPSGSSDGTGRPGDDGSAPSPSPSSSSSPGDRDSGRPDTGPGGSGSPSAEPSPSGSTGSGSPSAPVPTGPTTGPTAPTREPSTGTGPSDVPSLPSAPAPDGPGTGTGPESGGE